jgi:putative ABC transport system permease protein
VPGVRAVSHWTYFGGYFQNARNAIPAFATDPEQLFKVYTNLKIKPEYIDAMKRTRTGALISTALAKQYNWKIGDRIPIGTSIWTDKQGSSTWYFDVVGTFDLTDVGGGFPGFYLNHDFFTEASAFGNGVVHYYLVGLNDPNQATRIAKEIDALFANSSNETRTQTESELAQMQLKQIGDINFIVNAIVGAVLFTLLFLTANTMMQSVRERTSELAVLKTLGFSDTKVLVIVLVEALLLCVFAALLGLALASLVFPVLKPIFGNFRMPLIVVGMGSAMALALAFISGFPPAWRARQLNIVDALAGR